MATKMAPHCKGCKIETCDLSDMDLCYECQRRFDDAHASYKAQVRRTQSRQEQAQCHKCKPGKPCLCHTILPFGLYAGCTFQQLEELDYIDERGFRQTGLGYLDWLSGQAYIYGDFRKRLIAFLSYPSIARQLDELFPDPDDDSRSMCIGQMVPMKREVTVSYVPTRTDSKQGFKKGQLYQVTGIITERAFERYMSQRDGTHPSRHENVGCLAQDPIDDFIPKQMRFVKAWSVIVDFIVFIDECFGAERYDLEELASIDFAELKQACQLIQPLNPGSVNLAREKYRAYRKAVSRAKRFREEPTGDPAAYQQRMAARATPKPVKRQHPFAFSPEWRLRFRSKRRASCSASS